MKIISRVTSAILTATLLASIITVAPFSVSAVQTQIETYAEKTDSNIESTNNNIETTNADLFHKNEIATKLIGDESVGASEEYVYGSFKYTLNSKGEAIITKYSGNEKEIEIPSSFDEIPIAGIGNNAFINCSFTRMIISNGLSTIGNYAFQNCKALQDIQMPESVTSIGSYAFENCDGLTSITIPKGVTNASYLFSYCDNLKTVTFADGMTSIPQYILEYASSVENIVIPDTVTSIGNYAFSGCANLPSIIIPNSVKSIGSDAFSNCSVLQNVFLGDNIVSINKTCFSNSPMAIVYVNHGTITSETLFDAKIDYLYYDSTNKTYTFLNNEQTNFVGTFDKEISFNCSYSLKTDFVDKLTEMNLVFWLPDNVSIKKNSVKKDGQLITGYSLKNGILTIPIEKSEGTITFSVTVEKKNSMRAYAKFVCKNQNNELVSEIIDGIYFDTPLLVTYDTVSIDGNITIEGIAPVNQDVLVFVDEQLMGTLKTDDAGKVSGTISLFEYNNNDVFNVNVKSKNRFGEYYKQDGYVRIMQDRPSVSSFSLVYNGTTYDLMSEETQNIKIVAYSDDNPQPMKFVIKMNNASEVDSIDVVSVKSDEKEYLVANWDEQERSFRVRFKIV